MAQALLLGPNPELARPLLEEIAGMDPKIYPSGLPFGHFGLAELERVKGDLPEARRLYRLSEQGTEGHRHFERCYPQLGLIELDRIQHPHVVRAGIRALLDQPGVREHPALEFSAAIVEMRAFGHEGDGVEAARRAAAQFRHRDGNRGWEDAVFEATLAAIDSGGELPPLIFNLP